VLYDGFQPVQAASGATVRALTHRTTAGGGSSGPQPPSPSSTAAAGPIAEAVMVTTTTSTVGATSDLTANWGETVTLRGVRLSSTTLLVFELLLAKPGVAGLPTREVRVAWGFAPVMIKGKVVAGMQSVPLFRLPLLLTARRKFTYCNALLDFRVARYSGAPGGS